MKKTLVPYREDYQPQFSRHAIHHLPGMSGLRQRSVDVSKLSGAGFLSGRRKRDCFAGFLKNANGETEVTRIFEAKRLLEAGVSPDRPVKVAWQPFRTTPLLEAAIAGEQALVAMLLDGKADPNLVVGPGLTAVYEAGRNGHAAVVQCLCNRGASVDTITSDGFSPLYIASQNGHAECVAAMLASPSCSAAVANCAPEELGGATALHVACQSGSLAVVEHLLRCDG